MHFLITVIHLDPAGHQLIMQEKLGAADAAACMQSFAQALDSSCMVVCCQLP